MVTILVFRNLRFPFPRKVVITAAVIACAITLVSCKSDGDKSEDAGSSTQSTTGTQATTAPAEQVAAGQLDYFTERYLPAEERLKRRQDRIQAILSAPPPAPAP